ncbi:MAG TPA: hypothetical protein VEH77_01390 [Roseiarcus sp.]|nr:hypothetical protein [Roseiarcus sp.]
MPARHMPRLRRRSQVLRQFDLFDAIRRSAVPEPDWKVLPEAARHDVMAALTRLMLDHRRQPDLQGREARHDD